MAKLPAPGQLLTINDVAALCRVSSKTVRRWIKTRELPRRSSVPSGASVPATSICSSMNAWNGDQRCPVFSNIFMHLRPYRENGGQQLVTVFSATVSRTGHRLLPCPPVSNLG